MFDSINLSFKAKQNRKQRKMRYFLLLHILYLSYFSRQRKRKEKKKKNLDSRERALSAAIAENSIEVQGVKIPHFPLYFAGEFRYPPLVYNWNLSVPGFQQMKPCHVLRWQWILGLELSTTMCRISVHLDRRC